MDILDFLKNVVADRIHINKENIRIPKIAKNQKNKRGPSTRSSIE
jgi:hypothetical protein